MSKRETNSHDAKRKQYAAPQVMEYGAVSDLVRGFKMPYIEIEGKRDYTIA